MVHSIQPLSRINDRLNLVGFEVLLDFMGSPKNRSSSKIEKKLIGAVRETIARYGMFAMGDRVLMAVSGGPDSVVLTHILNTIAGDYSLQLAIAHLNHSLRGQESDRDAEFVAALAEKFDLPCYLEKKDVKTFQRRRRLSPEEAARRVRYEYYDAVSANAGFNKIALGHHSDDNAELVLMNLLRGSGPLGLSGIAPLRDSKIVRPLIHLKRSEILEYVSAKNIAFVTDTSNTDPAYRRNQIRHHLIPELKKSYNPAIVGSLNRLGEILQAENQWMEQILEPVFADSILDQTSDGIRLALSKFNKMHRAAGRRIIRKAILSVKHDLRRITFSHVDAVLDLAGKTRTGGFLDLPDGIRVIKDIAVLTIKKEDRECPTDIVDYHYTISAEGTTPITEAQVAIKLVRIDIDDVPDFKDAGTNRAFFDRDCLRFPLVVRNFQPGDRFSPLGVAGTQKLKKFFINNKIPARQRYKCPLLVSENKIIWVGGLRIDNSVKLGLKTRRVLMAELLLAQ
jgi:tRNA(Ile)-lysidine synthase